MGCPSSGAAASAPPGAASGRQRARPARPWPCHPGRFLAATGTGPRVTAGPAVQAHRRAHPSKARPPRALPVQRPPVFAENRLHRPARGSAAAPATAALAAPARGRAPLANLHALRGRAPAQRRAVRRLRPSPLWRASALPPPSWCLPARGSFSTKRTPWNRLCRATGVAPLGGRRRRRIGGGHFKQACRNSRAFSQSRATVRTVRPSTPAISASVMPAK